MKKVFWAVLLLINTSSFAQLSGPESIEFDPANNRYLIANSANGRIMQRLPDGTISNFVTGISPNPYGLEIVGNVVYACSGGTVKGYDLSTGSLVFNVNLGGSFLNGITHDPFGYLYITDFNGLKIYKLHIATQSFTVFAQNLVQKPNGIVYHRASNALVFANWGASAKIKSCSLADSTVTTLLTTSFSNIDGIALKDNGDMYISVWSTNSIYKYNHNFTSAPQTILSGLSNPADIYYNNITDTLAIPNSGNNTIRFIGQYQYIPRANCNLVFLGASGTQATISANNLFGADSAVTIQLINSSGANYAYPLAYFDWMGSLPAGTTAIPSSQGFQVFASAWNGGDPADLSCYLSVNQPIAPNYMASFRLELTNIDPSDIDTCFFTDTFTVNLNPQVLSNTEEGQMSEVKIYPNPVRDLLHIDAAQELAALEIRDVSGRIVKQYTGGVPAGIDLSMLPGGIYFLRLYGREGKLLQQEKLLKQ